ncbi:hypothetical protein M501DRAFT_1020630 [Patellaria atrata CBS 101060]|uniref:Uncharacterized protein n=1 Tax=Patellaria atrata CBS 101060 TaxID=1346257 RepID=A0A9P4S393_9PEZI|nr:hypothetical protein M501DRAFT_1020630 [Patellaria atrata CBS 101060]
MRLSILSTLIASFAVIHVEGDFIIIDSTTALATFTNTKDASAAASRVAVAASTYITHLTAQPQFTSAIAALESIAATATDIPEGVTATDTVVTYTTTPAWYTRLPQDMRDYYESIGSEAVRVVVEAATGAAPRPTGMLGVVGGVMGAAAVGAGAILL